MKNSVNIEIDPAGRDYIRRILGTPIAAQLAGNIRESLDRANLVALSHIQTDHFSGTGPYPVSQGKLGVVSGRLKRSLQTVPAVVDTAKRLGVATAMTMGTNVKYAAAHEFGDTDEHQVPAHSVKAHKRTRNGKEESVKAHTRGPFTRRADIPERAPLRTGLQSQAVSEIYSDAIIEAVEKTLAA